MHERTRLPSLHRSVYSSTRLEGGVLSDGRQQELLEQDRAALCSPRRYQAGKDRQAYRNGHEEGQVVLEGRTITVRRPHARSVDGRELEFPTWEHMRSADPLKARVAEQILVGVTTRKYATSLELLGY